MDSKVNQEDVSPVMTFPNQHRKQTAIASFGRQRLSYVSSHAPTATSVVEHIKHFRYKCVKLCNLMASKADLTGSFRR